MVTILTSQVSISLTKKVKVFLVGFFYHRRAAQFGTDLFETVLLFIKTLNFSANSYIWIKDAGR